VSEFITALIGFSVVLALCAWVYQKYARTIIRYAMRDDDFAIIVFGRLKIVRIPYNQISEVRELSLGESMFRGIHVLRIGNRLFGKIVVIRKASGIFREILISPDNSQEFIAKLREKLSPPDGGAGSSERLGA
jgi:hypothetical protein